MAGVTYHGEFPEGQDTIVQHGYEFSRDGKSVNVTDKELVAKFAANRFFKTDGSEKEDVQQGQEEAEQAEAETLKAWLGDHQVPYRANASLANLRKAREDYEAAQEKAAED